MFWIEFLMEEFELVVTEEYKFEYGAEKLKVANIGNFELSRQWSKEPKSTVLPLKNFQQMENFWCRQ